MFVHHELSRNPVNTSIIDQADKDGNESIDFSEFSKLWAAIKGEGEVTSDMTNKEEGCSGWLVCGLPINIGYLLIMPPNTRRGPEIIFIIFSLQFSSL